MSIPKYKNKFEERCAEALGWEYEPTYVPYEIKRRYLPDFHQGDTLVECKGYFRPGDTQKYKAIRDSLGPEEELIFVLYDPNKKVRKENKITMGEWCTKEGFKWFTLETLPALKEAVDGHL